MKFRRDLAEHGFPATKSHFGYLCVEGMRFGRDPVIDPETGEVLAEGEPVLPRATSNAPIPGRGREVENPAVWVFPEGVDE